MFLSKYQHFLEFRISALILFNLKLINKTSFKFQIIKLVHVYKF